MEAKIPRGSKVRETVTGFVGYVTAYLVYDTGCVQYQVEVARGTELKAYWIDEGRLEVIKPKKRKTVSKRRSRTPLRLDTGGPSRGPSAY